MSLAGKGSRAIEVDGEAYRWALSPDSSYDVIVVQAAGGTRPKLLVYAAYGGSQFASADDNGPHAVTPALVAAIIRQARDQSWQPDEAGKDAVFDLQPDGSIVLRATPRSKG